MNRKEKKYYSSFTLRFCIAAALLIMALFMDKSGINLAGITSDTITRVISTDYETYLETWVNTNVP